MFCLFSSSLRVLFSIKVQARAGVEARKQTALIKQEISHAIEYRQAVSTK
jgi:sRNA-binding carbon storage regulator CsrA